MPSLGKAESQITGEDFDSAEKWLSVVEKEVERFTKLNEVEHNVFQKDMDIFKASLDNSSKNLDRNADTVFSELKRK